MKRVLIGLMATATIIFSCKKENLSNEISQSPVLSYSRDTIYIATFLPKKWNRFIGECINSKGDCFDPVDVRGKIPSEQRDLLAAMVTMEPAQIAEMFANNQFNALPEFALPEFDHILQYLSTNGAVVEKSSANDLDYYKFSTLEGTLMFVIPLLNE